MAARSSKVSLLFHISPVILLSLLLNIPKFISITSLGLTLQKIPQYLKFILFFQAFHPLTTTGLAPLIILCALNYKGEIISYVFCRDGDKKSKEANHIEL